MQPLNLQDIRHAVQFCCSNPIDRLRMEEEMLYMLVKNPDVPLAIKKEAFCRIELINKKQSQMFGHAGLIRKAV